MDPEIRALIQILIDGQIRTDRSVNELAVTVTRYVDASETRLQRLEENLDRLIRAITSEHTNGHSKN